MVPKGILWYQKKVYRYGSKKSLWNKKVCRYQRKLHCTKKIFIISKRSIWYQEKFVRQKECIQYQGKFYGTKNSFWYQLQVPGIFYDTLSRTTYGIKIFYGSVQSKNIWYHDKLIIPKVFYGINNSFWYREFYLKILLNNQIKKSFI